MRFIIKSKVQHPGKRGGKFWIDKKGEIQYGEKPNARQAKSKNKPVIKKNRIEPEEYKKHGIPEDAKHALSYEGHDKYIHEWRDSKGRLQRRYRPEFVAKKQADKYKRITNAINRIPELREAVNNDINGKDTLKKFTALAIKIMDLTGARVGNEKYTEDNETHGITTLEKSNVTFRNNVAVLNYVGKKGVQQTHEVDQPEVVSALRELKKMPGKRLFEIDEKGNISSDGVNKYLKEYGLTAKDLRTFRANVEFTKALMTGGRPKDDKGRKTAVANALKTASAQLGNTPDVCRTNYISPEILEGYLRGRLSLKFAIAKGFDVDNYDELFDSDEMAFLELWSEATAEGSEGAEGAEGAEGEKPEGDKPVLEKSHVKGHVRATKTGKIVPVRDYENRKRKQNNTNLIDKFAKQSFENVKHQINEPNFKQLSKEKQKEVIINAKIRFKNEAANFIDTIIKKDCDKIFSGILHPRNKKHRAWFTELTGIKMPSTLEETNKTLIKYVGENNHTQYLEKKRIEKEEQSNKYLLENALAEITRPHKIRYNGTIFNTTKEFIDYRLKEGNYKVDKTVKGIKPIYKIRDKDGDGWMPISSKNERIYIDSVLSKRKIRKSIHYFIKSQVAGHQRVTETGKVAYVHPYQNRVVKKPEDLFATPEQAGLTPAIRRGNIDNIPLEMIERDESQPRETFEPDALRKLGESIKKIGLMQPIGLRPAINGTHKIIFGERRWRAARLAGLTDIPARIFDIEDKKELYAMQVAENLAKEDMNPIETANAFRKLHDVGMGNEEIAERTGVSPVTVQRKMSLTTLIPEIQNLVKTGDLTETNGILIGQAGLQSAFQFEVLKKINASTKKLTRDELDGIVSRYQTAQNQTSLFGMVGTDVITGTSQINKNKVEAVKKQIANLLGNVVKAAEKIINNKNYKIAPAILKEQGKLAHTKEELKLLQNYLGTIVRELEAADAFFHSGGTVAQYLSKQKVKKETRKRIRKAIYLIKSIVRQHTRTGKSGKIVQVGQYVNKKTKRAEPVSSLKAPKDYDEVVKRYGDITATTDTEKKTKKDDEKESPFIAEARKYKSAEEFVKAQGKPIFRGGKNLSNKNITDVGVSFSSSKKVAEDFIKIKGGNLSEYIINPDAKIVDYQDVPNVKFKNLNDYSPELDTGNRQIWRDLEVEYQKSVGWAKEKGYDAVKLPLEGEYRIINPNSIKSKSQLIDIWNEAHKKGDTNPSDIPASLSEKCRREKPGSGGEIHLSKKEVTTLLRHGVVGFISAGTNPNSTQEKKLSDAGIKTREKHLRDDLVKQGLKFVKVTGKYGEVEDSYMVMVPNVKDKELIELGKRYNQDSVIYSDHGKNKLIFTTGENVGKSYNGNGFQILNNDAEDFYTEVDTKKGKLRFSLKFDFSKLTKSIRYFVKSIVKQHTRKTDAGKLVNVKQYVNRKTKQAETKEPWQMTKKEIEEKYAFSGMVFYHKEAVQQALSRGKPVPAEVLKDYPDLAEKYGRKSVIGKVLMTEKPIFVLDDEGKLAKVVKWDGDKPTVIYPGNEGGNIAGTGGRPYEYSLKTYVPVTNSDFNKIIRPGGSRKQIDLRMWRDQFEKKSQKQAKDVPVMDEETYLSMHGASRQDIGDSALHKNRPKSDRVWRGIINRQSKKDAELIEKRERLRAEYYSKVEAGELRPRTRIERLISTANGDSVFESTKAARRLLKKQGIEWRIKKSIRYLIKGKVFPVGHVSIYRDGTVWKKIKDTGQSDDWKELVDAEKTKALKKVTGSVSSKGAPIKTVRTLRKEGGKVVQTEKVSGRNRTTVEENKTHKDVGVKVGGAKKDIWAQKVRLGELLSLADVVQIENEDQVLADKLVIKENLWKKPDIEEMKNQGMSAGAAYMVNWTYNTIKSKPEPEYRKEYPIGLSNVSKMILNVKSVEDYKSFYLAVENMIPYKMGDTVIDAESHKYKIVNTPEVRRQFEALGQSFFENFYTKRRSADYYKFKSHYSPNMSKSYRYALHDAKEFEINNDWGWADIQSEKRDKADLSGAIVEKYIKIIKNNKRLHDIAYWTAVNSPNAKGWNFASHIASNWVYGKMKGIREDLYKYKSVLSRKYHDKKENFDWYLDYKSEELGGVLTAFEFETYKKKVEKYRTKNAEYGENIPASIYKNAGFEHDKWRGEEVRKFSSETNDPEFNLMNEFRKAGITDPIAFTKAAYKWRIDSIPEKDVPTVMKRKGPAVGGGDEKSIHKRFGLRGIEYGNYVDDESREYHSNQCTMAFADLARILKISEKDVSFNGRLAIGFGTRGTGTANATYHPDRKIINITKNRGGGSLAHEWSHFFDNIMGERSGKLYAFASEGELNNQPEIVQEAYRNLNNSINCVIGADHEIYHGKSSIASWGGIDTFIENNNNDATKTYQAIFNYYRNVKSDDKETRARLAEYIAKKCGEPCVVKLSPAQRIEQPSEFRKRSEKCGTYWSKKLEMFARAFSCYIEDKLESRGEYNTYLLRNTKKDLDTGGYFYPYPVEKERKTINKAFDELFRVIRDSKELKKSIFGQGE